VDFWGVALPGYLTGGGTLGLAWFTYRAVRESQSERRDRLEFEQRAQARRVNVDVPKRTATGSGAPGFLNCTYVTDVHNDGPEPIMSVQVTLHIEPSTALTDGDDGVRRSDPEPRVMPGSNFGATAYVQIKHPPSAHIRSETEGVVAWAEVEFTDSADYVWRRSRDHLLDLVRLPRTGKSLRRFELARSRHETQ
jgi:hypothetical protein